MSVAELLQPVLAGGIKDTNFFSGRILTAEDLRTMRDAEQTRNARLARVLGEAIALGLDVRLASAAEGSSQARPLLALSAGIAFTPRGDVLELGDSLQVALVREADAQAAVSGAFAICPPPKTSTKPTNLGLYVLTMSPTQGFDGLAPRTDLGNEGVGDSCGRRYAVEGLQFRLPRLPLQEDAASGTLAAQVFALAGELDTKIPLAAQAGASSSLRADVAHKVSRLRNGIAHLCYGTEAVADVGADPWGAPQRYGLLDRLRDDKVIADCEVPLALVYWTSVGVRFVDPWALRLPLVAGPYDAAWPVFSARRRMAEGMAALLQFQRQLADIEAEDTGTLVTLKARESFFYLPPVGFLPLVGSGFTGASFATFFDGMTLRASGVHMEGSRLGALVRDALGYPPVDVDTPELVWTYRTRQNEQAAFARRPFIVFANGHKNYDGASQFDLSYWDYANFA